MNNQLYIYDCLTGKLRVSDGNMMPVGAGPYAATDADNNSNPSGASFWSSNIVYFKANENFMFDVKAEKLRMQVVSSSDAIDVLESGAVDYVVPQFTKDNADRLTALEGDGFKSLDTWQLGYGYIGINGAFRIFADGSNQHSLDIMQITASGTQVINKAPKKFTSTPTVDFTSILPTSMPKIYGKDQAAAEKLLFDQEPPAFEGFIFRGNW